MMTPSDNGIRPDSSRPSPGITPIKKKEPALDIAPVSRALHTAVVILTLGLPLLFSQRVRDIVLGGQTVSIQGKVYYTGDLKEEINRQMIARAPLLSTTEQRPSPETFLSNIKLQVLRAMLAPEVEQLLAKQVAQDAKAGMAYDKAVRAGLFEKLMQQELKAFLPKPNLPQYKPIILSQYKAIMRFIRENPQVKSYTSAETLRENAATARMEIENRAEKAIKRELATSIAAKNVDASIIQDAYIQEKINRLYDAIDSGQQPDIDRCRNFLDAALIEVGKDRAPIGLTTELIRLYKGRIPDSEAYRQKKEAVIAKELERLKGRSTPLDAQMLFEYCLDNRMNKIFESLNRMNAFFPSLTNEMDVKKFLRLALAKEDLPDMKAKEKAFWEKRRLQPFPISQEVISQVAYSLHGMAEQESKRADDYSMSTKLAEQPLYALGVSKAFREQRIDSVADLSKHSIQITKALSDRLRKNSEEQVTLTHEMSDIRSPLFRLEALLRDMEESVDDPDKKKNITAVKAQIKEIEGQLDGKRAQLAELTDEASQIRSEIKIHEKQLIALREGADGLIRLHQPIKWHNDISNRIESYRFFLRNTIQIVRDGNLSASDAVKYQEQLKALKKNAEEFRRNLTAFQGDKNEDPRVEQLAPKVQKEIERLSLEIDAFRGVEQRDYAELEAVCLPNLQFAKQWFADPANEGRTFWVHEPSGRYASKPISIDFESIIPDDWHRATPEESVQFLVSLLAGGHGQYDMSLNRQLIAAAKKQITEEHTSALLEARIHILGESGKAIIENLEKVALREGKKRVVGDRPSPLIALSRKESPVSLYIKGIESIIKGGRPSLQDIQALEQALRDIQALKQEGQALLQNRDLKLPESVIASLMKSVEAIRDIASILSLHVVSEKLKMRLPVRELAQAYRQVQQCGGQIWQREIAGVTVGYQAGFHKPEGDEWNEQPVSPWNILASVPDLMSQAANAMERSPNDFSAVDVMSVVNAEMAKPYYVVPNSTPVVLDSKGARSVKDNTDPTPDLGKVNARALTPTQRKELEDKELSDMVSLKNKFRTPEDQLFTPEEMLRIKTIRENYLSALKKMLIVAVRCYVRLDQSSQLDGNTKAYLLEKIHSYKDAIHGNPIKDKEGKTVILPPDEVAKKFEYEVSMRNGIDTYVPELQAPSPSSDVEIAANTPILCMGANNVIVTKDRGRIERDDKLDFSVPDFNAFLVAKGGVDELLEPSYVAMACLQYINRKLESNDPETVQYRNYLLAKKQELNEGLNVAIGMVPVRDIGWHQILANDQNNIRSDLDAALQRYPRILGKANVRDEIAKERADLDLKYKDRVLPGAARIAYRHAELMLDQLEEGASAKVMAKDRSQEKEQFLVPGQAAVARDDIKSMLEVSLIDIKDRTAAQRGNLRKDELVKLVPLDSSDPLSPTITIFKRVKDDFDRFTGKRMTVKFISEEEQKEAAEEFTLQLNPIEAQRPVAYMPGKLEEMRAYVKALPLNQGDAVFVNLLKLHTIQECAYAEPVLPPSGEGLHATGIKAEDAWRIRPNAVVDNIDIQIDLKNGQQVSQRTYIVALKDKDVALGYSVVTISTKLPISLLQKLNPTKEDIAAAQSEVTVKRSGLLSLEDALTHMDRIATGKETLSEKPVKKVRFDVPAPVDSVRVEASAKEAEAQSQFTPLYKLNDKGFDELVKWGQTSTDIAKLTFYKDLSFRDKLKLQCIANFPKLGDRLILIKLLTSKENYIMFDESKGLSIAYDESISPEKYLARVAQYSDLVTKLHRDLDAIEATSINPPGTTERPPEVRPIFKLGDEVIQKVEEWAKASRPADITQLPVFKQLSLDDQIKFQCIAKFEKPLDRLVLVQQLTKGSTYTTFERYLKSKPNITFEKYLKSHPDATLETYLQSNPKGRVDYLALLKAKATPEQAFIPDLIEQLYKYMDEATPSFALDKRMKIPLEALGEWNVNSNEPWPEEWNRFPNDRKQILFIREVTEDPQVRTELLQIIHANSAKFAKHIESDNQAWINQVCAHLRPEVGAALGEWFKRMAGMEIPFEEVKAIFLANKAIPTEWIGKYPEDSKLLLSLASWKAIYPKKLVTTDLLSTIHENGSRFIRYLNEERALIRKENETGEFGKIEDKIKQIKLKFNEVFAELIKSNPDLVTWFDVMREYGIEYK